MAGLTESEAALERLLAESQEQGVLDDQFIQLRSLEDDSNPDFVKDLIDLYYADAQGKIESMGALLSGATPDLAQLDQLVHQFKGSSASFGAATMASICIQMRNSCHAGDAGACRRLCDELKVEFLRLQECLTKFTELDRQLKG